MPRFRVAIANGVTHLVDADNEDEARKKTAAEIAKGAVSPFYDELFFDYETGVNIKDPRLAKEAKSLRQKLGRAERSKDKEDPYKEENKILDDLMTQVQKSKDPRAQEGILQNSVGAGGYIRNTKGQVALTPKGLQLLGLPVQQRKLKDGSLINLNTIVDENSFNMRTGDFADMSGIAGPVVSTIVAFMPQTKILKTITALLGGRERLGRTLTAGVASPVGKAAEEYLDTMEGFQLQDRDELKDLYTEEFIIGSVGQGLFGEVPGALYKTILGKKAPIENQRAAFVASRNLSWPDVKKLDREAGKPLTNDEILKAAKKGKIQKFDYAKSPGFLPSRAVFDQKLPANYQAIVEQVLSNKRNTPNTQYLRAATNGVLKNIKDEKALLNDSLSKSSKEGLDEQVNAALQKLRLQEQTVTNSLRTLLDDIGESVIQVGDYGDIPANKVFGQELKETMGKARNAAMEQSGDAYHAVDKKFVNFRYDLIEDANGQMVPDNRKFVIDKRGQPQPEVDANGNPVLKTETDLNKSKIINKAINNIIGKHLKEARKILDADISKGTMQELSPPGAEISSNIRNQLDRVLTRAETLAKENKYDLRMVRNDANYLRRFTQDVLEESDERKLVINMTRIFDDYGIGKKGIKNQDSILTEIENDGMKQIDLALGSEFRLDPAEKKQIISAIEDLRRANKNHYDRMLAFDDIEIKRLVARTGSGIIQADDVYSKALISGSKDDLENIFKGLREYDDYIKLDPDYVKKDAQGKIIDHYYENKLKADLKNRLFADALREATKDELTDVNFTQFAKEIKRFEKEHGKFDVLFQDPATGQTSGPLVRDTIEQLNMIGFNPKPAQLRNLINDITRRNATRGLNSREQGRVFVESLKKLADATEDRMKFERTKAIADLPNKTIEETVNTIFRPRSASTINALKESVNEDVFNDIQQASMQKLLSKSIDMNGEGKITDLFRSQNLKTSLDSFGDETLDAMFGVETRRGLRDLQFQIDVLTAGEAGRGGAAGGLIAAGLSAAIVFAPLATLPTVTGLAIAKVMLSFPPFVRIMSRSDAGSTVEAVRMLNAALRQFGMQFVNGEIIPFASGATGVINQGLDLGKTAIGITDDDVEGATDEGFNIFQQLRNKVTAPIKQLPGLPDVQSTGLPDDPMSQDRLDFAEQVAGRPIL